ncbi:MAG: hypothetical protein ACMXYE_01550 [Candidatus Woesearchaeota archaeon]
MKSKIVSALISANISVMSIFSTAYFTHKFHQPIHRMVNNIMHRDIQTEEGHFKDPYGLQVVGKINEQGKRETYLIHTPSQKKIQITPDMFPQTASMLEKIVERSSDMTPHEAHDYLRALNTIQGTLYEIIDSHRKEY